MLRTGKADQTSLLALVKGCATLDVEADGITFLADSTVAEEITKDSEYKGTRILMDARMGNVRIQVRIDFGVGDVMVPGPRMVEYPVFLGSDTIQLLAYPVESAIAEKLQAMVALWSRQQPDEGLLRCVDLLKSSRLRHAHASQGGRALRSRIGKHLSRPEEFEALMTSLVGAHRVHWNAFVKKDG